MQLVLDFASQPLTTPFVSKKEVATPQDRNLRSFVSRQNRHHAIKPNDLVLSINQNHWIKPQSKWVAFKLPRPKLVLVPHITEQSQHAFPVSGVPVGWYWQYFLVRAVARFH